MAYTLITGASAGIGETFARTLAARGHDLILLARRRERLDELASELARDHGIQARVISADLARPESAEAVARQIESSGWALSGLINNAGFGERGRFESLELEPQLAMIQVNVTSLVDLTWRLLPALHREPDSFIINVASTAAFQAGPNMAIYYASKAFVLSFSEALHEELRDSGISVSALCPGATESEFAARANMTDTRLFRAGAMSPQAVVDEALARRQRSIVVSGWRNRLMVWGGKLSPRWLNRRLAGWLQA